MPKYVVALFICLSPYSCFREGSREFATNTGPIQTSNSNWQRAALTRQISSYQLDSRGTLRIAEQLPAGMIGEWLPLTQVSPNGTALDAFRTSEAMYLVPDDTIQVQVDLWTPGLPAPISTSQCPAYQVLSGRLQRAAWRVVRPLGPSGGYMLGLDDESRPVALSDACVNALHAPAGPQQQGPYIYTDMNGEMTIAKEFINDNVPQPLTRTTKFDLAWPICLQRIYMFLQQNWFMYSQGGLVDDSGRVIRPSTLVCAEADDPRIFIAPDRIYPRHTTAYDPFDHRVLEPDALANMWNQWEVLIETFTSWRNLGSYWIKIEGEKHHLLRQAPIVFGWNAPEFPAGVAQDSDDHAWLHPAGYLMPSGLLTNGNGRLQFSFKTWTPPTVMHLTLTATTNVHPNTSEPPAFPGYSAGLDPFVYSDYPEYAPSRQSHGGYISVPLDMTDIEWPE